MVVLLVYQVMSQLTNSSYIFGRVLAAVSYTHLINKISTQVFTAHCDVSTTVSFTKDNINFNCCGLRVGIYLFVSLADDSFIFLVFTR